MRNPTLRRLLAVRKPVFDDRPLVEECNRANRRAAAMLIAALAASLSAVLAAALA